jgi:hypothetical protein
MSCLFRSIGALIGSSEAAVRADIVAFLSANLDSLYLGVPWRRWIQWQGTDLDTLPEAYLQQMQLPRTWGGAMEITAASQCFGIDVVVVNCSGKKVADFCQSEGRKAPRRLLLQWSGCHYVPLRLL